MVEKNTLQGEVKVDIKRISSIHMCPCETIRMHVLKLLAVVVPIRFPSSKDVLHIKSTEKMHFLRLYENSLPFCC